MYRYMIRKDNWKKTVWWCKCMILFKYILGKKSTKNLKKDALIPKLIQLYFFPSLLMHVVWWHQQHHTREKSYLNWLALSQKCVFFCTSRSILHLSTIYISYRSIHLGCVFTIIPAIISMLPYGMVLLNWQFPFMDTSCRWFCL